MLTLRSPFRNTARRALLPCAALLALGACESPESNITIRSDSAGITVATALAPLWAPGEGWTIAAEPLLEIGAVDGPGEYLLDGVVGVARLEGGDIVVGEWTSGELRRYDRDGAFIWRAGRDGEGPGEHRFLSFVGSLPGDSVVTYDGALERVQIFGPDGAVARVMRIESPWSGVRPLGVAGVSRRQLVMTFMDRRGDIPVGAVRWPGIRVTLFSLDDGAVAEVMDVPGTEQYIVREGTRTGYQGYEYGKAPRFAVMTGHLAVVDTEAFVVRSVSLDDGATTAILRRNEPAPEVTSEHVEAHVELMARQHIAYEGLSEEQVEALKPSWRESPMASTLPVLESIRLDGRQPMGGAVCPPGFRTRPLRGLLGGRYLAGVRRDAAGSQTDVPETGRRSVDRRRLHPRRVDRRAGRRVRSDVRAGEIGGHRGRVGRSPPPCGIRAARSCGGDAVATL